MIVINKRLVALFITISLLLLILGRFFYLQVVKHEYYSDRAMNKRIRILPVSAPRGIIEDRNGLTIVDNAEVYDLLLNPSDVKDNFDYQRLLKYIKIDTTDIKSKVLNFRNSSNNQFTPISLKNKINRNIKNKLLEQKERFPGLAIRKVFIRKYINNSNINLAHVLSETKIERKSSTNPKFDIINLKPEGGGLEKYYDNILRGTGGKEYHFFDAKGMDRGVCNEDLCEHVAPKSGDNIQLTIDMELQNFIYNLMQSYESISYEGSIICSIPETGEILAFVNSPTFDIEKFSVGISQKELDSLNNLNSPYLNRGINAYLPGSVMKLPVAMMLLEEGVSKNTSYDCNGEYVFPNSRIQLRTLENGDIDTSFLDTKKCHANHGKEVDLKKAISESCNAYFYQSVDQKYNNIYKNKWYSWMEKFGFVDLTNIDLLYEKKGNIQNFSKKRKMINMVIGQEMLVTPLQVMQMINVIVNEGVMTKLYFNKNSPIIKNDLSLKTTTIDFIKDAMESVVNEGTGNNSKLDNKEIIVRGKTGTAQLMKKKKKSDKSKEKNPTHAWYSGYIEYDNKKISLVIMLEKGGSGSEAASLMAKEIFNKIFDMGIGQK